MNIVDTKLERCWFNNLDEGDVFLHECTYYIKTNEIISRGERTYNAARLHDGLMVGFPMDKDVQRIDCTLEIK